MATDDAGEPDRGCRCGAVRYAVPDAFLCAANCHRSGCRVPTGSAFRPLTGIERSKLALTPGDPGVLPPRGDENVAPAEPRPAPRGT